MSDADEKDETLDRKTGAVVERVAARRDPPARGELDILTRPRLGQELHSAWVCGEITGFPDDDSQLAAATRWLDRMDEIEAEARARVAARHGQGRSADRRGRG